MQFSTSALAAIGLASVASAHMIMTSPVPYGKSSLTNSPLLADGSDFPCKQRTGVYALEGASNTMPLGSTQSLAFQGSAVHGGGSCQVSITYDQTPTASSTWKVIHSIEGGCPQKGQTGNSGNSASQVDPDTYSYTIPTTLPTGNATLAWTWFNKIGNREMYMNCAPVSLTSSSSKRSELVERDQAAFNALPDMFVANIDNGCTTVDSTDLIFPNPGDSLEMDGTATSTALHAPTGTCQSATGGAASGTAGATSAKATSAAAATSAAPAKASTASQGGVFATVPTSAAKASATSVASVAPASSVVATSATAVASSAAPASTGTTGTGTTQTAGSACATEGEWNCIGGTSYQQCASGTWSVVMQLAAGTSCTAGESTAINIVATTKNKRAVRFSREHFRRHLLKRS
ncbi:hypothetical protein BP6252_03010 [Coleophoma cylindrospora]|uniref:Lytic polysaccharide monooxygenase n=1 Tax=Coleophoma cylindrospora TaxID=1849047 RepID=A0A3D8S6J8_9HELO|nr:hypothetical protein BP6252_03010 [Coleophoma cylindrospora]